MTTKSKLEYSHRLPGSKVTTAGLFVAGFSPFKTWTSEGALPSSRENPPSGRLRPD